MPKKFLKEMTEPPTSTPDKPCLYVLLLYLKYRLQLITAEDSGSSKREKKEHQVSREK